MRHIVANEAVAIRTIRVVCVTLLAVLVAVVRIAIGPCDDLPHTVGADEPMGVGHFTRKGLFGMFVSATNDALRAT